METGITRAQAWTISIVVTLAFVSLALLFGATTGHLGFPAPDGDIASVLFASG